MPHGIHVSHHSPSGSGVLAPRLQTDASRPSVLLVEDDSNDVFFTQLAWEQAGVSNPLHVCENGEAAVARLNRPECAGIAIPCAILTDLKMPRMDGFALLAWLQGQPRLAELPRIV